MRFEPTTLEHIAFDKSGKELFNGYFDDVYQSQHKKENLKLIITRCEELDNLRKENNTKKIKYIYISVNDEQTSSNYLEILE